MMPCLLFTIGHSNHDIDTFIGLLQQHHVNTLVDVRSHPYSRYNQQFRKAPLQGAMTKAGIGYMFLGQELGPCSPDPDCYIDGQVSYGQLAQTDRFHQGLQQVQHLVTQQSAALMCAEYDPICCHRAILVSRSLYESGYSIHHILRDGTLESHEALEDRLLKLHQLGELDTTAHLSKNSALNSANAIAQLDLLAPLELDTDLSDTNLSDNALGTSPQIFESPQQLDLFEDWLAPRLAAREQAIAEAYRRQGEAIAHRQ